jgi:hypothetical protein
VHWNGTQGRLWQTLRGREVKTIQSGLAFKGNEFDTFKTRPACHFPSPPPCKSPPFLVYLIQRRHQNYPAQFTTTQKTSAIKLAGRKKYSRFLSNFWRSSLKFLYI